jgi:hypothetical protein
MTLLVLTPKEEAYILCYITMYYNCDKRTCWKQIGEIIKKHGTRTNKVVYRGHSKKDSTIKQTTPFVSTTPKKDMADLFVERNWELAEDKQRVGHLFTIHLKNVPTLSTRNIHYTFTNEVKEELRKINKGKLIQKGNGTYTFDEFFPKIKDLIQELVFDEEAQNSEEILVLTGGTFYKDSSMKIKGFKPIGTNDFETWYSFSNYNTTRKNNSK